MEILKNLNSFEDACKMKGYDPLKILPDVSMLPQSMQKYILGHIKLPIIIEEANRLANNGKKWEADYGDFSQSKFELWLDLSKGSSGLRCGVYAHWIAYSHVGSRLCFISEEVGEAVFEKFIELYRDIMF